MPASDLLGPRLVVGRVPENEGPLVGLGHGVGLGRRLRCPRHHRPPHLGVGQRRRQVRRRATTFPQLGVGRKVGEQAQRRVVPGDNAGRAPCDLREDFALPRRTPRARLPAACATARGRRRPAGARRTRDGRWRPRAGASSRPPARRPRAFHRPRLQLPRHWEVGERHEGRGCGEEG